MMKSFSRLKLKKKKSFFAYFELFLFQHQHHSMDDDEDDSELRVKANVSKVIPGVRVVEAVTKKHGVYKLSINDIVGASKYKPDELKGAEIGKKPAL